MATSYLVLAIILAFTLNNANRWVRAGGTFLAALGLTMIAFSIYLANVDGTFAAVPVEPLDRYKPLILNIQAIVASAAAFFLLWAAWFQAKRRTPVPIPPLNGTAGFGLVSRYFHWITATLILCLIPMGLFISVLKAGSAERADFLGAHQSLGLIVLVLVACRLSWLLASPPPASSPDLKRWERQAAHAVHIALYGLILAFPVSGLFMSAYSGETLQFFGATLPALVSSDQNTHRAGRRYIISFCRACSMPSFSRISARY